MDFINVFCSICALLFCIPMFLICFLSFIPDKVFGKKDKEEYDTKISDLKNQKSLLSEQIDDIIDENAYLKKQNAKLQKELLDFKNRYFESVKAEVDEKTSCIKAENEKLRSEMKIFKDHNPAALRYLKKAASNRQDIDGIFKSICNGRLNTLFDTNLYIKDLNITSSVGSGDHYYDNVTLTECSCPDFRRTHLPCKHMLYLIYSLGILQLYRDECYKRDPWIQEITTLQTQKKDLQKNVKNAQRHKNQLNNDIKKLTPQADKLKNDLENYEQTLDKIIEKKCDGYPQLAGMLSDYKTLYFAQAAEHLRIKSHPAPREALRIEDLRIQMKRVEEDKSMLEYQLGYIYALYPDIEQIFDNDFDYKNAPPLEQLKCK